MGDVTDLCCSALVCLNSLYNVDRLHESIRNLWEMVNNKHWTIVLGPPYSSLSLTTVINNQSHSDSFSWTVIHMNSFTEAVAQPVLF